AMLLGSTVDVETPLGGGGEGSGSPDAEAASGTCCCFCCCCSECSARWVLSCLRRLEDTTNDFKHSIHLKGLSPECTRRCLLRLERSANDLSHSVSQDATKSAGCRNLLEHLSQGKGFSPVCERLWLRSSVGVL
uniref:Uncharacterized protein n=1 Tax=Takifugu rubripes TaxID=31033 RepID=A0A674NVN5_TAKRU